jgi:hypothetical protein
MDGTLTSASKSVNVRFAADMILGKASKYSFIHHEDPFRHIKLPDRRPYTEAAPRCAAL